MGTSGTLALAGLRDELNLGNDVNLSSEDIYYITLDGNSSKYYYDMPTGNEPGAISGEWVPGGTTKYGTPEAALHFCEDCIHSKDINNVLEFFGKNNWLKIK